MSSRTEIIFVEGHSTADTWAEKPSTNAPTRHPLLP